MEGSKTLISFIKGAFSILIVLLVIYGIIVLATTAYDFGVRVFTESAIEEEPGQDVVITVDEGMSTKQVANMLEEKGLIRDASLFQIQTKLSAYSGGFVAGEYTLNTSMTPKEMIVIMANKESDTETTEGEEQQSTSAVDEEEDTVVDVD